MSYQPASPMPLLDGKAAMGCIHRTRISPRLRWLSRGLAALFAVAISALAFLPWQQFVQGSGKVIAFDPLERSVILESPLSGRVEKALVVEGQEVKQGQLLFEIVDNDPNLLANLTTQKALAETERDAAQAKLERLTSRVARLEKALPQALEIARKKLDAARYSQKAADLQYERIKKLYEDPRGLSSQRDFELAEMKRDSAQAETLEAEAALLKAKLDQEAALDSAQASVESARSDLSKAQSSVTSLEIRLAQLGRQKVEAPRDGVVFRVQVNEGAYLKEGAPLCTVIPEATELVVQLWIDGNDMPLLRERQKDASGKIVRKGSPVRLQFEGWPAIQFVGWPSAARGTFGGEVIFVDAADNGMGQFRVLVAADPDVVKDKDGNTEVIEWPSKPVMRQGIGAQGWVLLERVPLWLEAWRQLNGFPPALSEGSPMAK